MKSTCKWLQFSSLTNLAKNLTHFLTQSDFQKSTQKQNEYQKSTQKQMLQSCIIETTKRKRFQSASISLETCPWPELTFLYSVWE